MSNTNKRIFLNLDYVQGEEIEIEFDIQQDCEQLYLDEYNFVGAVIEDFNDIPVAVFQFNESATDVKAVIASISSSVTDTLNVKVYTYEVKMASKADNKPETILYGTLNIKAKRV